MAHSHWRTLEHGQISRLVVIDIDTGDRRVLHESATHVFEAPNWSPDGTSLVFNQDGLFLRIPADGGEPVPLASGTVDDANNDHVLSPDGRLLYASAGDGHIHEITLDGTDRGNTRRVTGEKGAGFIHAEFIHAEFIHYLHGISPDGRTLAYIGMERREGLPPLTNVFTVSIDGSSDTQLTHSDKPHDGSEFSPDGEWIYFNSERASERSGHSQLFRMRRDGSRVTQLTDDDRVNWFPHVSPDGNRLVYVSFEPGVEGHPANKNIVIRSLHPQGGAPQDVCRVFGGQGTLNVTSWAPDSRRFAFVEYPLQDWES